MAVKRTTRVNCQEGPEFKINFWGARVGSPVKRIWLLITTFNSSSMGYVILFKIPQAPGMCHNIFLINW